MRPLELACLALPALLGACTAPRYAAFEQGAHASIASSSAGRIVALHGDAEDSAIIRIRAHYARIERERAGYRCRTLSLEGFSAEGGELEACFADDRLRRLMATYFGESGRSREQYYFWDDSLEFFFRRVERYTESMSGKVASSEEDRLYWSGGRLVRWLSAEGRPQPLGTPAAAEQDREARESALKLAACARNMADSVCAA